jgi:hypothetical protein
VVEVGQPVRAVCVMKESKEKEETPKAATNTTLQRLQRILACCVILFIIFIIYLFIYLFSEKGQLAATNISRKVKIE